MGMKELIQASTKTLLGASKKPTAQGDPQQVFLLFEYDYGGGEVHRELFTAEPGNIGEQAFNWLWDKCADTPQTALDLISAKIDEVKPNLKNKLAWGAYRTANQPPEEP